MTPPTIGPTGVDDFPDATAWCVEVDVGDTEVGVSGTKLVNPPLLLLSR